ncbi:MAG: ATP-dependent DNA ligase [Candidatus Thorarchaeota archaeon]|nr:MAG: ATP-dependent DNA ligase [Candidatus Thorarchaeota archaeon]
MIYEKLSNVYQEIEAISGSLEKTRILSEVLKEAGASEVGRVVALTMGKLHPDWMGEPEIGIAEKMAIQVVATAASTEERAVKKSLRETGDIGAVAELLLAESAQATLFAEELTITHVYETLDAVAKTTGKGSAKDKVARLVGLLSDASPVEAKYILRTLTGQLRLGIGDMGIIDALALAFVGEKEARKHIERAFNVCSDLARVAEVLAKDGLDSLKIIQASVGRPIRMMAAKKLSEPVEIIEKAGPEVLVEYKYDGERVQVHKNGEDVVLFSRRQEQITEQYPDVVDLVRRQIEADTCILEGECIAIDPTTGGTRPFQELMRRRRKTDIDRMSEEVPVAIRFFDILFHEGEDVTALPMAERRKLLESVVQRSERVSLTIGEVTKEPERLMEVFREAIDSGHEGVIAKAVHEGSAYQAGSRSWLWIKLKASYQEGMADSVDLVVVGAIHGRGKRAGLYGAILASAYDEDSDTFPTVCKIGTGFTDEMLVELKERLDRQTIGTKSPKVLSDVEADVWFSPAEVIEVLGDEMTISPTHSAGRGRLEGGGLAIRFPRFTGRWREDKDPKQATTVEDLIEIYERQRGRGQ